VIGIVIPAHQEQELIGAAVVAARLAAGHLSLAGEEVQIVVVLDACSDDTGAIAHAHGARTIAVSERNVGAARAAGSEVLLARGARWLAFTDADTVVAADWLATQLALQSDAVCGCVQVGDWAVHGVQAEDLRAAFESQYRPVEGHRHIHGANLGVSATAYRRAGGFQALTSSEDVALVDALIASGASVTFSAGPRVITSARPDHRAPAGFGETLLRMRSALASGTVCAA
jgi:glycosyltransferase involved in cell wall biosynthesis